MAFVALECPPLVLPPGVSIEECPGRPVYGDICIFRCAEDQSKQSASRRVRSCEVKNFNTVYWTGLFPRCSGLYYTHTVFQKVSLRTIRTQFCMLMSFDVETLRTGEGIKLN